MSTRSALHSTGKDTWRTPPDVLAWLDAEFHFHLDAAAEAGAEAFPGRARIGPEASETGALGVAWLDWMPRVYPPGRPPAAFVNPPYSKEASGGDGIRAWHRKAWEQSRLGVAVVVLAPPTIDRGWAHKTGVLADEWRIFKFRLDFIDPSTGDPARGNVVGSQLTIYRPHVPVGGWPGGPRVSYVDRSQIRPRSTAP